MLGVLICRTALHRAFYWGNYRCAAILLNANAHLSLTDFKVKQSKHERMSNLCRLCTADTQALLWVFGSLYWSHLAAQLLMVCMQRVLSIICLCDQLSTCCLHIHLTVSRLHDNNCWQQHSSLNHSRSFFCSNCLLLPTYAFCMRLYNAQLAVEKLQTITEDTAVCRYILFAYHRFTWRLT